MTHAMPYSALTHDQPLYTWWLFHPDRPVAHLEEENA